MSSRSLTFVIGHPALDADHQMIVELWRSLEATKTEDSARTVAARLMDLTLGHFSREEDFMRQCGFPLLEAHRNHHRALASELRRVILSPVMGGGRDDLVSAVCALMNRWISHILVEDARIAPYAKAHARQMTRPPARRAG